MVEIKKPKIEIVESKTDGTYGKISLGPLERGFGITLGNSLRRILLSSLPGVAVSAIKIDGVQHEFSTIKGVKEDVAEIILNIKDLILKLNGFDEKVIYVHRKGAGEVVAGDIEADSDVEILKKDQHIATLDDDESEINIEMVLTRGRGYVSSEMNKIKFENNIGMIAIDSIYSPVTKVNYKTENVRVGQQTDYDQLNLEVWTNGVVSAEEAIAMAARILNDHLTIFTEISKEKFEDSVMENKEAVPKEDLKNLTLEELDLSVRSYNCLKRAGINNLSDLLKFSEEDMMKVRNLGRKSLEEVIQKVKSLGFEMWMKKV